MGMALLEAPHGEGTELIIGDHCGLTNCHLCFPPACTDKELRSLASRLKDWFGALHEDANRVIKPTSPDAAQGSETTFLLLIRFTLNSTFSQLRDIVDLAVAFWGEQRDTTLNIYIDLKYVIISEISNYRGGENALESNQQNLFACFDPAVGTFGSAGGQRP